MKTTMKTTKNIYPTLRVPALVALGSLAVLGSLASLSSCSGDWLDLKPTNATVAGGDLSLREAEASANGLYEIARDYEYYGARMVYFGDVRADDFQANGGTKRSVSAYAYKWDHENVPSSLWIHPYFVARSANNIIRAADGIAVLNDAEEVIRKDVKGQALTMRALAYFDLCRVYGYPYLKDNGASMGPSIVLEDVADPDGNLPHRSTVKEAYEKVIIPDLLEAIPLLKSKKAETEGRVGKMTAMTLLSRVYLYCGNWDEAFKWAKAVIDEHAAAGFALYSNAEIGTPAIWSAVSPSEVIFEMIFNSTEEQTYEMMAHLNYEGGYDDIVATASFMDAWNPADLRKNALKAGTKDTNKQPLQRWFINKYISTTTLAQGTIKLMRISEAYLNAAEASTFIADAAIKQQGLEYYNTIHQRAGLTPKAAITLDDVLEERRFEFFGEGHRYFDLLRHDKTIVRSGEGHLADISAEKNNVTIDWDNYMIALPIPRAEMNANPNIRDEQNPGWGTSF
jgi:hypothetical protein